MLTRERRMMETLSWFSVQNHAGKPDSSLNAPKRRWPLFVLRIKCKGLPLRARLPAMWACPPGPPCTFVCQSRLRPWLQAGRSPAQSGPDQGSIMRLRPTRPLTQAQLPELRVRPGPLTCSPSPDTPYWFSSYIWAPVSACSTLWS